MSWDGIEIVEALDFISPRPEEMQKYVDKLMAGLSKLENTEMANFFSDWPMSPIEEWAVDFNTEFMLKYDLAYQADTMETMLFIRAFGVTSVDWHEYVSTYGEAQTMYKLKSNL